MTTLLSSYYRQALEIAVRLVPPPAENAPCHVGICEVEQCRRCRDALYIHSALDEMRRQEELAVVKAELPL